MEMEKSEREFQVRSAIKIRDETNQKVDENCNQFLFSFQIETEKKNRKRKSNRMGWNGMVRSFKGE